MPVVSVFTIVPDTVVAVTITFPVPLVAKSKSALDSSVIIVLP